MCSVLFSAIIAGVYGLSGPLDLADMETQPPWLTMFCGEMLSEFQTLNLLMNFC